MRVLVAPQEFKGTLTAIEAAEAIAAGLRSVDPAWELDLLPMADGGPGTLDALLAATGGERRTTAVNDPLMRTVDAEWGLLTDGAAIVECASASGLWRLGAEDLDPRRTSSYGTGELIGAAIEAGCREVLIGLGGSATNDGGAGMAQALGYQLLNSRGTPLSPGGSNLARLARIDPAGADQRLPLVRFQGATDVSNPLCGPAGASHVYGPQKGADGRTVIELDEALSHFADIVERDLGIDVRRQPGTGAAGGLGAGLIAFLGAGLGPGAKLVGELAGLETRIKSSTVVITGEGRLDGQTAFGKGPAYVAELARGAGKPCVCIAGTTAPGVEAVLPLFAALEVSGDGEGMPSPEEARTQVVEASRRVGLGLVGLVAGS